MHKDGDNNNNCTMYNTQTQLTEVIAKYTK